MKVYIKLLLIALLTVVFAFTLAACGGNGNIQADEYYVEVTGVRVPSAVVYLSPDGETSSYQLEPTVFPENATNRKLLYYVSPDHLEYFDVSSDGLIKAKKITEEGSVPIKIYSASNPNAYTIVSVIIEYVEVREIYFGSQEIQVLYNSEPIPLDIRYKPYHAQDGRDVMFTSQNPEVATVDNTGILSVHSVGTTTVIARGTTLGGKIIEGTITVKVVYSKGNYRLDVTPAAPRYEQVIGNPHEISFHIIRLDPHSDPNPDIKWRVGGNRIMSQNGKWEYKYSPDPDSTPATFTITVEITPKNEQTIILESLPITLYKKFMGFEVTINQPSGIKYEYGDVAAFNPEMENAQRYEWYINEKGQTGLGTHIATTYLSQEQGILELTMDKEGAFTLTVGGYNGDVEINRKSFEYNVIKYVTGDRVQIIPQIVEGEKIPESFDWYLHEYDKENEEIVNLNGQYIGTSVGDEPFNFATDIPGNYVISSSPTLDGLPVTVIVDGESQRMIEYSPPFTVWEKEDRSQINYLIVDGVMVDVGDYRPVIKWGQLGGANNFVIEVFSNNQIYLIDTLEKKADDRGIVFGDYSVVLPPEIATLSQDFSVRVKKRDGVYSHSVDYLANTISQANYEFLREINFSINSYIVDMYEMGEIINYISTYRPELHLKAEHEGFNEYMIDIQTPIVYHQLPQTYPVFEESEYEDSLMTNIYNIVWGAYNAYGIVKYLDFDIEYSDISESFKVTIVIYDDADSYIRQRGEGVNNYQFETNYSDIGREDYEDFGIIIKDTINVTTSAQLSYVVEMGKRPLPVEGSIAHEIYEEAKAILNRILSFNMTDLQKVLCIYDYLAENIEYDKTLYQYGLSVPKPDDLYKHAGYHLEGAILDKKALSAGVAKAFSLLCWIEGIPVYTINGTFLGKEQSWNKVLIGNQWYNIDASKARIQRQDGAAINHMHFLFSDLTCSALGYVTYGKYPACLLDYQKNGIKGYEYIDSLNQLQGAISIYAEGVESVTSLQIEVSKDLFVGDANFRNYVLSEMQKALEQTTVEYKQLFQLRDNFFVLVLKPSDKN